MGDSIQEYIKQSKEIWKGLNKRAKIIIGIGTVGIIIALILLVISSGDTQYQTLFSHLDPKDADAIIKKLDEDGIPYKLANGGRNVLVPGGNVYKTRLEMAGAGLPSQGVVGFEIFDQSKFGATDFERKVNYYRALGGELSRSIQAMDAVEFAKVQVTAPKESFFIDQEQPAEAAVLLKLAPCCNLSESQVRSITNLVASSVQGLTEEKVTIVDTAGNLYTYNLNQEDDLYNTKLTINQFELQNKFAKVLETDLRILLSKVLGPDNFSIQVKAKLDFDQKEVESKTYSPVVDDEGIIRSKQEQRVSYKGANPEATGVPGTTSNNPQYQSVELDSENGQYDSSDILTNYEINEKIERSVYAVGDVEKLSVAVIVNNSVPTEDIQKISDVVKAAIGYDNSRGDVVTVSSLPFDKTISQELNQAQLAVQTAERTRMYIYAGLIALTMIVLLILIIIFNRSAARKGKEEMLGTALDIMVDGDAEGEAAAMSELTEEEQQRLEIREEISDLISNKPEEVAQLIKSWLVDD